LLAQQGASQATPTPSQHWWCGGGCGVVGAVRAQEAIRRSVRALKKEFVRSVFGAKLSFLFLYYYYYYILFIIYYLYLLFISYYLFIIYI